MLLTAFLLLFFIIFTVGIQGKILDAREQRNDQLVDELYNIINNEVLLANSVNSGYVREFVLPSSLDGATYTLSLDSNNQDLFITFRNKQYLFFLEQNSTIIPLKAGRNYVRSPT